MYQIRGLHKIAEVDKFNEGCIAEGLQDCYIDITFTAETRAGCIEKCAEFVGVAMDGPDCGVELDACEEMGRIDLCKMENGDSGEPSPRELERWKRDEETLYYVVYTGQLEQVQLVSAMA